MNIVLSTNVPTVIALSRRITTRIIAEVVPAIQQAVRSHTLRMVIIVPTTLARHLGVHQKNSTVRITVLLTNAIVAITKKLKMVLTVSTIPALKMDVIGTSNMVQNIVSNTHVWQGHVKKRPKVMGTIARNILAL